MRGSFLVTVLEGLLTGADTTNRETTLKAIHDHLSAVVLVTPSDVLVMGFLILQVISRLFVRSAFQVANIDHQLPHRTRSYSINAYNERKFFPATENGLLGLDLNQSNSESGGNEPTSVELDVLRNVRAAISAVAERTFEKIQEACLVMLAKVEDAAVVRRSLGILSEVISAILTIDIPRIVFGGVMDFFLYIVSSVGLGVRSAGTALLVRHAADFSLQADGRVTFYCI